MSLTYPVRGDSIQPIVWLEWPDYLKWLGGRLLYATAGWGERVRLGPPWEPGEHDVIIMPTGDGKTTYAVQRLDLRKYVLALDPKGEDETLSASGYQRVSSIWQDSFRWRLSHRDDAKIWDQIWKNIDDGRPARVIVGGPARSRLEVAELRALMGEALDFCRFAGGWTMYVDEFEVMSSREIMNLAKVVNEMVITARRAKISVMTAYQAQAFVSKHAIRNSRRAIVGPTGDIDMVQEIARGIGHNWRNVLPVVDRLPQFHTATLCRGKHHPIVLTSAPKIG